MLVSLYLGHISLGVPKALSHFEVTLGVTELQNLAFSEIRHHVMGRDCNHMNLLFYLTAKLEQKQLSLRCFHVRTIHIIKS